MSSESGYPTLGENTHLSSMIDAVSIANNSSYLDLNLELDSLQRLRQTDKLRKTDVDALDMVYTEIQNRSSFIAKDCLRDISEDYDKLRESIERATKREQGERNQVGRTLDTGEL